MKGDGLDIHHAMQKHPAEQVVPGYNKRTGPSIALPKDEHFEIKNLNGDYNGTARQLLSRDLRNLRNHTNAPNSALQELSALNKQMFPGDFVKKR